MSHYIRHGHHRPGYTGNRPRGSSGPVGSGGGSFSTAPMGQISDVNRKKEEAFYKKVIKQFEKNKEDAVSGGITIDDYSDQVEAALKSVITEARGVKNHAEFKYLNIRFKAISSHIESNSTDIAQQQYLQAQVKLVESVVTRSNKSIGHDVKKAVSNLLFARFGGPKAFIQQKVLQATGYNPLVQGAISTIGSIRSAMAQHEVDRIDREEREAKDPFLQNQPRTFSAGVSGSPIPDPGNVTPPTSAAQSSSGPIPKPRQTSARHTSGGANNGPILKSVLQELKLHTDILRLIHLGGMSVKDFKVLMSKIDTGQGEGITIPTGSSFSSKVSGVNKSFTVSVAGTEKNTEELVDEIRDLTVEVKKGNEKLEVLKDETVQSNNELAIVRANSEISGIENERESLTGAGTSMTGIGALAAIANGGKSGGGQNTNKSSMWMDLLKEHGDIVIFELLSNSEFIKKMAGFSKNVLKLIPGTVLAGIGATVAVSKIGEALGPDFDGMKTPEEKAIAEKEKAKKKPLWKKIVDPFNIISEDPEKGKWVSKDSKEYKEYAKNKGVSQFDIDKILDESHRSRYVYKGEDIDGKGSTAPIEDIGPAGTPIWEAHKRIQKVKGDTSDWKLPPSARMSGIGSISAKYESGGKGPGTISTGAGDFGGKSYGTHQLSSQTGTLQKYLSENPEIGKQFEGLEPGSTEFDSKWKALAKEDPKGFGESQHKFIMESHNNVQLNKLKKDGIDLSTRGPAVQEAIFSTATQYGPHTKVISRALKDKDVAKMGDEDIIAAVQANKAENVQRDFKSSSQAVQNSVAKRIENEKRDLLALDDTSAMAKTQTMVAMQNENAAIKEERSIAAANPNGRNANIVNAPINNNSNKTSNSYISAPGLRHSNNTLDREEGRYSRLVDR